MINNKMSQTETNVENAESAAKKPDESSGVYFSSAVKIFDPETNEILLQKRGDD